MCHKHIVFIFSLSCSYKNKYFKQEALTRKNKVIKTNLIEILSAITFPISLNENVNKTKTSNVKKNNPTPTKDAPWATTNIILENILFSFK